MWSHGPAGTKVWPARARERSSSSSAEDETAGADPQDATAPSPTPPRDLATIRYRVSICSPTRCSTSSIPGKRCTSSTCSTPRGAGAIDDVDLEHVSFGSVLGPVTRKPLKTREGGAVELEELLDEPWQRAAQVYEENVTERGEERGEDVRRRGKRGYSEVVGIGAVKYADLSQNRIERLRLRPRQDAGDGRQYRHLHAVRLRPQSQHFPQGRRRSEHRCEADPRAACSAQPEERAAGVAVVALRGGADRGRRGLPAAPHHRLPVGLWRKPTAASSRTARC